MEKIPTTCLNMFPYISTNSPLFSSGSSPISSSPPHPVLGLINSSASGGTKSFSIEAILQGTTTTINNNNNHHHYLQHPLSTTPTHKNGGGGAESGGGSVSGRSDTSSPISVSTTSNNGLKKRVTTNSGGGGMTICNNRTSPSTLINPTTGSPNVSLSNLGSGGNNGANNSSLGNYHQHFPFIHHPAFHIHNQQAAAEILGEKFRFVNLNSFYIFIPFVLQMNGCHEYACKDLGMGYLRIILLPEIKRA